MFSEYSTLIIITLIVVQGYLISRVFEYAGITDSLSQFFLKKSKGSIYRLFFLLICYTATISLFVSNVICILTLLPILHTLKKDIELMNFTPKVTKRFTLIIIFLGMFSVNLGGLGTMTASPSHLILIGFLAAKNIPMYEHINFFTWFIWGIPLVVILGIFLYFICLLFTPKIVKQSVIKLHSIDSNQDQKRHFHLTLGINLSVVSFIAWFVLSILNDFFKAYSMIIAIIVILYTIFLTVFIFFIKIKKEDGTRSPLVPLRGLVTGIPTSGLVIIIISIIVSYFMTYIPIERFLSDEFISIEKIIKNYPILLMMVFGFATIFLSEIFSNTVITLMVFGLAVPFSGDAIGIPLMLSIALLASVPSMTPMATPVNSLALGSIIGSFNKDLLIIGLIMNIISTVVISFFTYYIVTWVFSFY